MKKNITFLFLFFLISISMNSQQFILGVKGGLNYTFGAELETEGVPASGFNGGTLESDYKEGFHGGIYGQKSFRKLFVRLEALYNTTKSDFKFDKRSTSYSFDKISIPILVGYHIFDPIDVYLGPGLSIMVGDAVLENEASFEGGVIPTDKSYLSANIGTKAHFGRFEIDLRYEHNFKSTEETPVLLDFTSFGGINSVFKNKRVNQIMLSVSLVLFDSSYVPRRKANRGCYF
ncbi:outer membrane beta-barrel protein [Zunongwangia sp.]|uniref:outer membrane beta-barrel protein n=1 Tax=Zunongwangia sp. TaxID=1965325 RepID=UPI003AA92529